MYGLPGRPGAGGAAGFSGFCICFIPYQELHHVQARACAQDGMHKQCVVAFIAGLKTGPFYLPLTGL